MESTQVNSALSLPTTLFGIICISVTTANGVFKESEPWDSSQLFQPKGKVNFHQYTIKDPPHKRFLKRVNHSPVPLRFNIYLSTHNKQPITLINYAKITDNGNPLEHRFYKRPITKNYRTLRLTPPFIRFGFSYGINLLPITHLSTQETITSNSLNWFSIKTIKYHPITNPPLFNYSEQLNHH